MSLMVNAGCSKPHNQSILPFGPSEEDGWFKDGWFQKKFSVTISVWLC
jgi:hypothetical protein